MPETINRYKNWANDVGRFTRKKGEQAEELDLEVVTLQGGTYDGHKVEVQKSNILISYSPSNADQPCHWEYYKRKNSKTFVRSTT